MTTQKIVIGVLAGLTAGFLTGLLTAPAKGSETRKKISDSADELRKKLRRIRGKAADDLDELHKVFENEIDGLKDDVREKVLKLIETSKYRHNHSEQKEEALVN